MDKKTAAIELFLICIIFASASFKKSQHQTNYAESYFSGLSDFSSKQSTLLENISRTDLRSTEEREKIKAQINQVRNALKTMDFWLRYLEPVSYKKINGPLPVEWETEVFEKFEKPYRREGAGLTLAALYLEESDIKKDSLFNLIRSSQNAVQIYHQDSITTHLKTFDHFYLCNRLFLLNLASIYTTGFECPSSDRIVPELRLMLAGVYSTYLAFNQSFPDKPIPDEYLGLYRQAITFINKQPEDHTLFDHFSFIKKYINPLFTINQQLIRQYNVVTKSYVDYSLSKNANSIFSKSLYKGQNSKGVFLRVHDPKVLSEIDRIGKLLFYDPILSGNNLRSCASCHKPAEFFTDTLVNSPLQFNGTAALPRNSPSLINAPYNHLLMTDGKHISLQDQAKAVITDPLEMACAEKDVLKKILSCQEYKTAFKALLRYTPHLPEVSMEHVSSAITSYYSKFSKHEAPFDKAINEDMALSSSAKEGFNVFMGKAQCATCHFAPQFNGVKPPYVSSEFEVVGVPKDTGFKYLSPDQGRYLINPSEQTLNAFRTGTIRNAEKTKPYMHNGVFKDLTQVVDFYDAGGGAGHGLNVPNQTLSQDSLHLSEKEKVDLIAFMKSLTETVEIETAPAKLPESKLKQLNKRKVGGEY